MWKKYNYLFDCIHVFLSCFPACLIFNRRLYEALGRLRGVWVTVVRMEVVGGFKGIKAVMRSLYARKHLWAFFVLLVPLWPVVWPRFPKSAERLIAFNVAQLLFLRTQKRRWVISAVMTRSSVQWWRHCLDLGDFPVVNLVSTSF